MITTAAYDQDERTQAYEAGARWVEMAGVRGFWSPAFRGGWILDPPPANTRDLVAIRDALAHVARNAAGPEAGHGVVGAELGTAGAGGSCPDTGSPDPPDLRGPYREMTGEACIEWKCFSWDGPAAWYADAALRHSGFQTDEEEWLLVAEAKLLGAGAAGERHPALRVVAVSADRAAEERSVLRDADHVHREVWGPEGQPSDLLHAFGAASGGTSPGQPHLSVHVAYRDDTPVAYGRLQCSSGSRFGGLFAGTTLPSARGRGCYRALVASRAREASERGVPWIVVDANPRTSAPILGRLGMQRLGRARPYRYSFGLGGNSTGA